MGDGSPCTPGPPYNQADPDDCTSYYVCFLGCVTHLQCEGDMLYDTHINYCNNPQNVMCEDRPCLDYDHCPRPSSSITSTTTQSTTSKLTTTTVTTTPITTTPITTTPITTTHIT